MRGCRVDIGSKMRDDTQNKQEPSRAVTLQSPVADIQSGKYIEVNGTQIVIEASIGMGYYGVELPSLRHIST